MLCRKPLSVHDNKAPQIQIGPLPVARGDRALLRQVWTNLISNAIKYTSKVPPTHHRGDGQSNCFGESLLDSRQRGRLRLEYVEKLFGVFHRLHRTDEFSGTGVGLAIVHRVVTRHGGRVWAEGKINDGAIFFIRTSKGSGQWIISRRRISCWSRTATRMPR